MDAGAVRPEGNVTGPGVGTVPGTYQLLHDRLVRSGSCFCFCGGSGSIKQRLHIKYETQGTGKNRTQRIAIYYRFVGYLELPEGRINPNYTADLRRGVAVEYIPKQPA